MSIFQPFGFCDDSAPDRSTPARPSRNDILVDTVSGRTVSVWERHYNFIEITAFDVHGQLGTYRLEHLRQPMPAETRRYHLERARKAKAA